VQPGGKRVTDPEPATFAGEDEERRLEGILRLVLVNNNRTAGAQDEWSVSLHQFGEGILGPGPAPLQEQRQEIGIGPVLQRGPAGTVRDLIER
jgi:hypothetical protein